MTKRRCPFTGEILPPFSPVKESYLYILFCEAGVPFYVGIGNRKSRWFDHEKKAKNSQHNTLKNAIIRNMQARGIEIPKVKIHENLTSTMALKYEAIFIKVIGRADLGLGPLSNLNDGGVGILNHSDETRAKMSESHRGKKLLPEDIEKSAASRRGQKRSLETRARMSMALRGRIISPETRAKMSAAKLGKKLPPEIIAKVAAANRGQKRSLETRARITAAKQPGKKRNSPEIYETILASLVAKERRKSPDLFAPVEKLKGPDLFA